MTEQISLTNFRSSELFRRKPVFFFSLFIILACIFCGIFFSRCLSSGDQKALISPICDMITSGCGTLFPGLFTNIAFLAVIMISGLSLYGFPLIPLVLVLKGISIGFCTGLLYGSEAAGILPAFIISSLFITAAFTSASFAAINYALLNISRRNVSSSLRKELIVTVIFSASLAFIASALQAIAI